MSIWSSAVVVFVPKLRYAGVKDATIHKILHDNPRRFLAFAPKAGRLTIVNVKS